MRITVTYTPPAPGSPSLAVYLSSAAMTWNNVNSEKGYVLEAYADSGYTNLAGSSITANTSATGLSLNAELAPDTTYWIRAGSLWNDGTTSTQVFLNTNTSSFLFTHFYHRNPDPLNQAQPTLRDGVDHPVPALFLPMVGTGSPVHRLRQAGIPLLRPGGRFGG